LNQEESGDEQMKYAFLILEPKRNDASKMVRHVLCSQSEDERDEWINAILYYVSMESDSPQAAEKVRGKRLQRRTSDTSKLGEVQRVVSPEVGSDHETIGIRYDQMAAGKRPATAVAEPRIVEPQRQSTWPTPAPQEDASRGIDRRMARSPQPLPVVPQRSPYRQPISGPMNGAPITDDSAWSSAQREEERRREEKRAKKRSVWGFLSKGIHFRELC
jgi:RalA-binding protein 1